MNRIFGQLITRPGSLLMTSFFLLFHIAALFGQEQQVTGRVIDGGSGEPLPGVNILRKGTLMGTVTDLEGRYSIFVIPEDTLIFSFIGFLPKEVSVENKTSIDIILEQDLRELAEVVVVGYGIQRKSDLTGAVATVRPSELQQTAGVNVAQAMQGRVSGVHITAQSGEPGESMRVRIRGTGTINNSDPVYVVDGIPMSDIGFLQPHEIESMEVLKDASATAIYGSRGANGVVLITTKKGSRKAKEAVIEFNSYSGIQKLTRMLEMCNATEYATLKLQAYSNDGIDIDNIDPSQQRLYKDVQQLKYIIDNEFKGTNWQSEILRTSVTHHHNLNISGGGDNYSYYIGTGFFDQQGIVKNSDLRKINFRSSGEFDMKKWMRGGISFTYVNTERSYIDKDLYTGVLTTALRVDPVTPAWNASTGNWGMDRFSQVNNNPARRVTESADDRSRSDKVVAGLWTGLDLFQGMSFRSQFGYEYTNYSRKTYLPQYFVSSREFRATSELHDERIPTENMVWSNYFNYTREFERHRINAMAGTEMQKMSSDHVKMGAFDVPAAAASRYFSSARNIRDYSLTTDPQQLWEQRLLSFFGRTNYVYNNRYLFTGTFRYDGSSKFARENRWGFFPSFSIGWNLREEQFLADVDWLAELKVRLGWGEVGNEGSVLNYQYMSVMNPNQVYVFGNQLIEGKMTTVMDNPELRWEVSQMANIGIDASLFNRRLDITADYFSRLTKDILVTTPVPYYFGSGAPFDNAADMRNSGIEFALNHRNRVSDAFSYQAGLNLSYIRNRVTSLGGADIIEAGKVGKIEYFTTRTEEGEEFAYFYGYKTDGIFNTSEELDAYVNSEGRRLQPNAEPGDVKFLDVNGDGIIDGNDRVKLGSGNPDFVFGITMGLNYKNFDFSFFMHGVLGIEAINALRANMANPDGIENSLASRMDSWTPENTGATQYRMTYNDPNRNILTFSDLWVEDASFLRMKNIQAGYNFPDELMERVKLKSLRFYLAVDNLFTVTRYSGWDPEIGELYTNPLNNGIDMGRYPSARLVRMGINISF